MTLDTHIYAHGPVDYREVFVKCNQLIGATEGTRFSDKDGTISNDPGQGLPGWLFVYYRKDAPLRTRDEAVAHDSDCEPGCDGEYHDVACYLEVSLDTAYGYSDDLGGCGDLHARFVAALGKWLEAKGSPWSWRNEFTGEVHVGADGLDELGTSGADARQWMNSSVLPAITTELGNRDAR